ncbi:MAG: tryptophan--tRNA ligase, partial [Candidatus Baldrarchaeia archaeon]
LHFGNKLFLDQALFLQKLGADVFIPISNDETYVFNKTRNLEEATKNSIENVIPDIIALGFNPKQTKIFISTKEPKVYELAVRLSTKTTLSTVKAIFGFTNETNPGQIFYTIVQSAHILLPQLKEFGGSKPVVVPIGIDQDPYIRLSRDIAEKSGFVKPSSTYHKFMMGLRGGKMSGSKPETCIFLNEKPETAKKKIMKAITGGAGTIEEQKKKGGNPDICSIFEYFKFHLIENDKKLKEIYQECKSGKRICGDCKKECADILAKFLNEHAKKKEKTKRK